jgi:anti-sigma B factor antagonist
MEIKTQDVQRVRILDLVGRLTVNRGAEDVYLAVRAELDEGHDRILLRLAEVSFIDSTGLGRLIASLTSATSRSASLKLLEPSPKVEDVLMITGTDVLFEIFHDRAEALASFADIGA